MLENLLRKLLIPVVVGITACSSPSDNSSGCLVDSDCLSGRYCRKEAGEKYGVCAFHEDIFNGDVSPEVVGCGNSVCEEGENCTSCALDCGDCKQLCEPCEGDYQCGDGSGKDMCINFPDSKSLYYNKKKFCAQDCTVGACPTGYDCMDVFSETNKSNVKQCIASLYKEGFPACVTSEKCDFTNYVSQCKEGKLYYCSEKIQLVKTADCEHYGLTCGLSTYYNNSLCYGFSKFSEPCPVWFDCNEGDSEANFCIVSNSGLTTYCSKKCSAPSDCPQNYTCSVLDTKEKACLPQK